MNRRMIANPRSPLLWLGAVCGLFAWLASLGADTPESREIKERLKTQAGRIKSLEVSFRREQSTPLPPEQLLKLSGFRNQLFLMKDVWHEAFKGKKRFRREQVPEKLALLGKTDEFGMPVPPTVDPKSSLEEQENQKRLIESYKKMSGTMKAEKARGTNRIAFDSQPQRDVIRAYNGRTLWHRVPGSDKVDAYQVWSASSKVNWFQVSPYQQAIGLHRPDPTGNPDVVKSQSMFNIADRVGELNYSLEEKSEVVDGSTCAILAGSLSPLLPSFVSGKMTDRIWLDRDHGLAVRRREMARDGRLGMRWTNTELIEVEPGLWLPTHCRLETFADDAPEGIKDKPVMIEEIHVTRLQTNKVRDEMFDMTPRNSDRVEDLRGVLHFK